MNNKKDFFISYLRSVNSRIVQYVYLLLILFFILILNAYKLNEEILSVNKSIKEILVNSFLWAIPFYFLVVLIPSRLIRKLFVFIEIAVFSVFHLIDTYLLSVYQMPYTDNTAAPLLATNIKEAKNFLISAQDYLPSFLFNLLELILVICIALFISLLITKGGSYKLFFQKVLARLKAKGKRCYLLIFSFCFILWACISVFQFYYLKKSYGENWIRYNAMSLPERTLMANKMVKKEIRFSKWNYKPQAPNPSSFFKGEKALSPHRIIIIYDQFIYPNLMHCYGGINKNTPQIDSLLEGGNLFIHTQAYSPDENATLALAKMFSFYNNKLEDSWDLHSSLFAVMRLANYKTFWLDNTPKVEPWLDVVPQLAADCDSSFYTNLRAFEECWTNRRFFDNDILAHLDRSPLDQSSFLSFIHLEGAVPSIWNRVPSEFSKYHARNVELAEELTPLQTDEYAQYQNIILNHDFILKEVIEAYESDPALIFFVGNVGAIGDIHPYDQTPIMDEDKNKVPFIIYINSKMKEIAPSLVEKVDALTKQQLVLDTFPDILTRLVGIKYSEKR